MAIPSDFMQYLMAQQQGGIGQLPPQAPGVPPGMVPPVLGQPPQQGMLGRIGTALGGMGDNPMFQLGANILAANTSRNTGQVLGQGLQQTMLMRAMQRREERNMEQQEKEMEFKQKEFDFKAKGLEQSIKNSERMAKAQERIGKAYEDGILSDAEKGVVARELTVLGQHREAASMLGLGEDQASFGALTPVLGPGGERMLVQASNRGGVTPVEGYKPMPDTPRKLAQWEQYRDHLVRDRGMPFADATDVAMKAVQPYTDPLTGRPGITNVAEMMGAQGGVAALPGQVPQVLGQGAPTTLGQLPPQPGSMAAPPPAVVTPAVQGPRSLEENIAEATGPGAVIKSAVNVAGPYVRPIMRVFGGGEGEINPDVTESMAAVAAVKKDLNKAFMLNDRGAVWEQQMNAQNILPQEGKFFTDPETQVTKGRQIRNFIKDKIEINQRDIESGAARGLHVDVLKNLTTQNAELNRILQSMGTPPVSRMSREELRSLDLSTLSDDDLRAIRKRELETRRGQ